MENIRVGIFETNSSSTHSMVIGMKSDFDNWKNGKLYYCDCDCYDGKFKEGKFYSKEEVESYLESIDETRDKYDFSTYDEFTDDDYLEVDVNTFTTPNGEVIKTVCKYGYDG